MLLWQQLQEQASFVKILIRMISSSCSVDVQDVTAVVVRQVLPRCTRQHLLRPAVQRFRRVMHRQSVSYRDYSADRKSARLSRSVMTLVQAVFLLPSVSLQTDLWSIWTRCQRNTQVLTEQSLQSLSHRREWQLLLTRKMQTSSLLMQQRRTSRQ